MTELMFAHYNFIATSKGISIRKNAFASGWRVVIPGGTFVQLSTDDALKKFVKGY